MLYNRFPILGTSVPAMLGREAILKKMLGALTKQTPDHLQMVGPRFAGKTVILHELATQLRQTGSPYSIVLVWDLGHQTPATDILFMSRLAHELASALKQNHSVYSEHLESSKENVYQDIAEVLDALNKEGCKVLIIMDGFDKPLSNGQLTRNLWDQLRELALKPSLRLITSSRRTLRELIRHPDAQTSDFWNIFDPTPVRVGCFNEVDLLAIFATLPNLRLAVGTQKELWNATNGFPVFILEILNAVCEIEPISEVSLDTLRIAFESAFPALQDKIDALWVDCSPASQDLFLQLLDVKTVSSQLIASKDADALIEKGFAHLAANKLQRANRLVAKYLEEQPHEGSAIARLFGHRDSYYKNFKAVLERRLEHFNELDPTFRRYFERGVVDLPDHPDICLTNVRGIVNHAFELIWKAELPDRRIPPDWVTNWTYNGERHVEDWKTMFPQGGQRVRLLSLMTGTTKTKCCAKFVSKGTAVLIEAIQSFGDLGQHQEGVLIDTGMAYSVLLLCIELAVALTRELPHP